MACSLDTEQFDSECIICKLSFTDARILDCGHRFCRDCILEWVRNSPVNKSKSKKGGIDCPTCRQVTRPSNMAASPEEMDENLPATPEGLTGGKWDVMLHCDPCGSTNTVSVATVYCQDCEEYLCPKCQSTHTKLRLTKDHTVLAIEKGQDVQVQNMELKRLLHCKVHPDKQFDFYCNEHQELACSTCAFIEHRHCSDVIECGKNLPLATAATSADITVKRTKKLQEHVKETIRTQKKYERMLEQDMTDVKVELRKFRQQVEQKANAFEARMIREGENMHAKLDLDIKDKRNHSEEIERKLGAHLWIAESLQQTESSWKQFIIMKGLEKEHADIVEEIANDKLDKFQRIKIQINENFSKSLSNDTNFGALLSVERDIKRRPVIVSESGTSHGSITLVGSFEKISRTRRHHMVMDCQFLNDSQIVVVHKGKVVDVLDIHRSDIVNQFKTKYIPWGIAVIPSQNAIAVTHSTQKKVTVYNIENNFEFQCEIPTGKECYGISSCGDDVVVSLCEGIGDWSLRRLNLQGLTIHELDRDTDNRRFRSLWNFTVKEGDVYQSCSDADAVYKFNLNTGITGFQYENDCLKGPAGITVDAKNNIYVIGTTSKNLHVVNKLGMGIMVVDNLPGCSFLMSVACSPTYGYLVVTDNEKKSGPHLYTLL